MYNTEKKGNVMKERIKKAGIMRKLFYYLTNVISEYNIGRVNCLA